MSSYTSVGGGVIHQERGHHVGHVVQVDEGLTASLAALVWAALRA